MCESSNDLFTQVAAVNAFSQTLRRYTSLNHLAQAARAVLHNSAQISQMLSDLNRVDFHNVQEQVRVHKTTLNSFFHLKLLSCSGCLGVPLRSGSSRLVGERFQSDATKPGHAGTVGSVARKRRRSSHETLRGWVDAGVCPRGTPVSAQMVVLQVT